ncbi:MAG: biotin/lipoate A/B protein ligase family protein [Candidatus Omnitrophota bacterium]
MTKWRLLLSRSKDPYTNMAIDEAILKSYSQGQSSPTLRIYGWSPESISLGYFQKANKVLKVDQCLNHGVLFVRRITGGEAIYHGSDLTYSIICSKNDLGLPESVKESFKLIASFLIGAYKKHGLDACFSVEDEERENYFDIKQKKRSDFCFATNQDFDITIAGRKIGGNAQKRRRDIIFQHGSIPLHLDLNRVSLFLREELDGVEERIVSLSSAAGKIIDFDGFSAVLIDSFQETFGLKLTLGELTAEEKQKAAELRKNKYANGDWNFYADTQKAGVA